MKVSRHCAKGWVTMLWTRDEIDRARWFWEKPMATMDLHSVRGSAITFTHPDCELNSISNIQRTHQMKFVPFSLNIANAVCAPSAGASFACKHQFTHFSFHKHYAHLFVQELSSSTFSFNHKQLTQKPPPNSHWNSFAADTLMWNANWIRWWCTLASQRLFWFSFRMCIGHSFEFRKAFDRLIRPNSIENELHLTRRHDFD